MPVSPANRLRLRLSRSAAYLRARDLMMRSGRTTYWVVREDLARRYLTGQGIEIGALAAPLRVPRGVRVRYVDRMSRDELVALEGPSLAASGVDPQGIVSVDAVEDAERLSGLGDDSVDFVIAAHVLEHLEDPIEALHNMLRVTRPGGRVLIVLTDPRFTVDHPRARTTVDHVVADDASGPAVSRVEHHTEWGRDIEGRGGEAIPPRVAEVESQDERHHFQVWEMAGFLELLLTLQPPCEIIHAQAYAKEFAVVLRSTTERPDPRKAAAPPEVELTREDVRLPAPVTVRDGETMLKYMRARLRQHTSDSYAGVPLAKFPEDLRVYEHLLWLADPDVVIELGVHYGASSLWFRDRLNALARYRPGRRRHVISVDVDLSPARGALQAADQDGSSQITLIEASVTDPALPDHVKALLQPGARCMVIEDTAHVYETTAASLRGFSQFVTPEGFFVVEDGVVDIDKLRIDDAWPRGVLPALRDWLTTEQGSGFTVRADLELYGVTCHPGGFLQRRTPSAG